MRADLERLEKLKQIKAGWYCNGKDYGEELASKAYGATRDLLDTLDDDLVPAPYLFITPAGGVRLEWDEPNIEIEVSPNGEFEFWGMTSSEFDLMRVIHAIIKHNPFESWSKV